MSSILNSKYKIKVIFEQFAMLFVIQASFDNINNIGNRYFNL